MGKTSPLLLPLPLPLPLPPPLPFLVPLRTTTRLVSVPVILSAPPSHAGDLLCGAKALLLATPLIYFETLASHTYQRAADSGRHLI